MLRRVLYFDAATCVATGALLSLAPAPLGSLLGLPPALLFYAGLSLFPIAAFMLWVATRRDIPAPATWLVIAGNAGWVIGSLALFAIYSMSGIGMAFVVVQAAVVGLLAELEYNGLRRIAA